MEFNMDTLSVRWKPPKEKKWRGAYKLGKKWKDKKVYVFIVMEQSGSSVECELLQWWFIVYADIDGVGWVEYLVDQNDMQTQVKYLMNETIWSYILVVD